MRSQPSISNRRIAEHLTRAYGLRAERVQFLPLGADAQAAAYRVTLADGAACFLKLHAGSFDETPLLVTRFLYEAGVAQIIPPIQTLDGALWSRFDSRAAGRAAETGEAPAAVLFPFVAGSNAWERPLNDAQWLEFGRALRRIHTLRLPDTARISKEEFSPRWREAVRDFQSAVERRALRGISLNDPTAAQLAALMRELRPRIDHTVRRAEELGDRLRERPRESALCHADLHAGNLLLAEDGGLFIVDWDSPIYAPVERDLMFIGGGVGGNWNTPREAELFYAGYGPVTPDPAALAYYRYERVVEDIAAFCDQIFDLRGAEEDRRQGLAWFASSFNPGGVLEIAERTDEVNLG